jgi:hypothetical protein
MEEHRKIILGKSDVAVYSVQKAINILIDNEKLYNPGTIIIDVIKSF